MQDVNFLVKHPFKVTAECAFYNFRGSGTIQSGAGGLKPLSFQLTQTA